MKFKIGDCIILNHVKQPYGRLISVVVGYEDDVYHCKYLNISNDLDFYNKPHMTCDLEEATLVEDFGVVIKHEGDEYWCESVGDSKAIYSDGKPRKWQEFGGVARYKARPDLAKMLWDESQKEE